IANGALTLYRISNLRILFISYPADICVNTLQLILYPISSLVLITYWIGLIELKNFITSFGKRTARKKF
ncbi:MAG: hypothetical protein ACJ72J_09985, partial [Nitrososphaeraceae archaeon]